jgi:hypothetical protein
MLADASCTPSARRPRSLPSRAASSSRSPFAVTSASPPAIARAAIASCARVRLQTSVPRASYANT